MLCFLPLDDANDPLVWTISDHIVRHDYIVLDCLKSRFASALWGFGVLMTGVLYWDCVYVHIGSGSGLEFELR